MIQNYKNKQFPDGANFHNLYLGTEYGEKNINTEYGDSIKAIYDYTNDFVFFSVILCEDLQEHTKNLIKRYKKGLSGNPPKLSNFDFSAPRKDGFIPPNEEYEKWLAGFPKVKPHEKKSWIRVLLSRCFSKDKKTPQP